jgi:hypothetical protein
MRRQNPMGGSGNDGGTARRNRIPLKERTTNSKERHELSSIFEGFTIRSRRSRGYSPLCVRCPTNIGRSRGNTGIFSCPVRWQWRPCSADSGTSVLKTQLFILQLWSLDGTVPGGLADVFP